MITALEMIMQERERQQVEERYSLVHDDEHGEGQLALLAAAYALSSRKDLPSGKYGGDYEEVMGELEAYDWEFKPKGAVEDLVRAGALVLAELERVIRELNI